MDTFHESHPSHVIVPKVCSRKNVFIYEYPKVKHGPLTQQMAILCLKAFIMKQALDELHEKGASCNDLRLPNMCFNEQYMRLSSLTWIDVMILTNNIHFWGL